MCLREKPRESILQLVKSRQSGVVAGTAAIAFLVASSDGAAYRLTCDVSACCELKQLGREKRQTCDKLLHQNSLVAHRHLGSAKSRNRIPSPPCPLFFSTSILFIPARHHNIPPEPLTYLLPYRNHDYLQGTPLLRHQRRQRKPTWRKKYSTASTTTFHVKI